jgi:hypothetical protein
MGELAVCAYAVDIRGADTHAGEAGASWLLMDLVPAQAQRPPLTPQTRRHRHRHRCCRRQDKGQAVRRDSASACSSGSRTYGSSSRPAALAEHAGVCVQLAAHLCSGDGAAGLPIRAGNSVAATQVSIRLA